MSVPLNAIRVFVSAARSKSFVKAADELHVTPGAVSRQVKVLEDFLGVALYNPGNRNKTLTDHGKRYFQLMEGSFSEIEKRTRDFIQSTKRRSLSVSCSTHFMRQWLVPRMPSYLESTPDQETVFMAINAGGDFPSAVADVGVIYGSGPWEGLYAHPLFPTFVTPVCTPRYLAQHGPLKATTDLSHMRILYSQFRLTDWRAWMNVAGSHHTEFAHSLAFPGTYHAYLAAMTGSGIALGRRGMIEPDLNSGRLVAPFNIYAEVPGCFHVVCKQDTVERPAVRAFIDWIAQQATNTQAIVRG